MELRRVRAYRRREIPFTLHEYRIRAEALLTERLEYLQSLHTPAQERAAERLFKALIDGSELADPAYAAKWSALSRKRYCGLLLSALYLVAAEHDLDMTTVLGHRLLRGWTGRSISNRTLIRAFGTPNRSAAGKSEDWAMVPALIKKYSKAVLQALVREKHRVRQVKDLAWLAVQKRARGE